MERRKIISLVLKAIVVICAIVGTILSAIANKSVGVQKTFMYFTIQSNIAIAIICLVGFIFILLNKDRERTGAIIKLVGTVSITLTGIVFCAVLAPTMGIGAWKPQSVLTHAVVPSVAIADYFVLGNSYKYKKAEIFYVILPPIAYAIYAGIGYALKWSFSGGERYPYFFLNWGSKAGAFGFAGELPFMGCVYWIILLFGFLVGVGFLYTKLVDIRSKNINN